jgi:hypothetical protein
LRPGWTGRTLWPHFTGRAICTSLALRTGNDSPAL